MNKIISKKVLVQNSCEFVIDASEIAANTKPGQFVILRLDDNGERIPLTIADSDETSITVVVQNVGKTTKRLCEYESGSYIKDVCGPLGNAATIQNFGTVLIVGGGTGIAAAYPEAKALKSIGNKVITIIGARSFANIIWYDRLKLVSDEVFITTDDGSFGIKGRVTDALVQICNTMHIDKIIAIGPVIMMKSVCDISKGLNIATTVSLNPIMVDGIGMCGACRVKIANKTKFSCVDGPEFDGHLVDWDNLLLRNKSFCDEESCNGGKNKPN